MGCYNTKHPKASVLLSSDDYEVEGSVSMVTVFSTELATPLAVSVWPELVVPTLRTFCARSRVLRRLAATVAEIPWVCAGSVGRTGGGGVGRGVTLGRGMEGVVLVLAMEASVCTSEVRMGVERGSVEEEATEEESAVAGIEGTGDTEVREETNCEGVRL